MPSPNSSSLLSETLRSITGAKLTELSATRSAFENKYNDTVQRIKGQEDPLARVTALLEGVRSCFDISPTATPYPSGSSGQLVKDLLRLDRFLEQARFDPSLSSKILGEWQATLLRHLDVQRQRYEYATLYGQLVTEWLSANEGGNRRKDESYPPSGDGETEMEEAFDELPEKKRLEAREHFEASLFSPADVDVGAVHNYLTSLFADVPDSTKTSKALSALRESTEAFESHLSRSSQFDISTVGRSIRGLLSSDLFPSGEKRNVLKSFQGSTVILSEIADVLNMRLQALPSWTWGTGGVPVEQRRRLNGRFDVYMHEDLLQAIFLHFIGVEWSVHFKRAFQEFRRSGAWTSNFRQISRVRRKRREYYLGQQETDETVQRKRRRTYRKGYFVYSLLNSADQNVESKDGDEEAQFESAAADLDEDEDMGFGLMEDASPIKQLASRAARASAPGAMRHRRVHVAKLDDEESEDDHAEENTPKDPMEKRQDLLHLLATEAAVNKRVHGSFTAFRTGFDDLQNTLPHEVVKAVLSFFGVSEKWRAFFRTYLEAPLRFLEDGDASEGPRKRQRGAPSSHALSDVFSETLLFCLDFSVNRRSDGAFLYRLSDDLWFWSHDYGKVLSVWKEIEKFARTMALGINEGKSGSTSINAETKASTESASSLPAGRIRWGMMYFDPDTLRFKIDQRIVDDHVSELQKQLKAKDSVFDWVQVWNTYANTFFASNFGKAANCFGRDHVDDILATHQRIQKAVFEGRDFVQHLKFMIETRFDVQDLADGFLFFPVELGGLEVRSPFVSPLQIRDQVAQHPCKILDDFAQNEKEQYRFQKTRFDKGEPSDSFNEVEDPHWKPAEGADEFMSFEEWAKYREEFTTAYQENDLSTAYEALLEKPEEDPIQCSPRIQQALEGLQGHKNARGILPNWHSMDAYWKWIAQMYGPEMIERCGGMSIVEPGLLPIGMVGMFRDQKVKWQG